MGEGYFLEWIWNLDKKKLQNFMNKKSYLLETRLLKTNAAYFEHVINNKMI